MIKKISAFIFPFIIFLFISSTIFANPVKDLFEQGLVSYTQGHYSEAIKLFEKVVQLYPRLAAAYNYIGLSQKALDMSQEKVLASFEKALEVNPSYAPTYDSLSKYYYHLGEFDTAEKYGIKAIELDPTQTTTYLALGWICLIGQNKPEKAVSYFEKALGQTESFYIYFGLGIAYYMQGENYKVLDMITFLREKNEEALAVKLERLLQSGPYNADKYKDFISAMLLSEVQASQNPAENKQMMPQEKPSSMPQESGADRILELQKRGADFYNKDLYY